MATNNGGEEPGAMKTVSLGQSELRTTRLIYGCMRIAGTWNPAEIDDRRKQEAFTALEAALESGYNHFDHADIYAHGACERLFGEFLRGNRGLRERIIITTKCGIRWAGDPDAEAPHRYDFSAEHIQRSCEGSLQRLGIDAIDVYLLHRPDVLMNPDEVAAAFDRLHAAGKVRHFGVSNFTPTQVAWLQSRLSAPLLCNQIEVHPLQLAPIEDGTLDALAERRITATSWSPLAGGRLGDPPSPASDAPARLLTALDVEACACGVSRTSILLAWLLRHPAEVLPIIGSRRPDRIRDATAADSVDLSREAWYRIYLAARGKPLP
jgi:predicted oxidoreductase